MEQLNTYSWVANFEFVYFELCTSHGVAQVTFQAEVILELVSVV
jgi:hypothetical protein